MSSANLLGTVEVQFKRENVAKMYACKNLNSEKWKMYTMYMGDCIVRITVGAIHPDIRAEWLVATLGKDIQMDYTFVSSHRSGFVNWWWYSLQLYLAISEVD